MKEIIETVLFWLTLYKIRKYDRSVSFDKDQWWFFLFVLFRSERYGTSCDTRNRWLRSWKCFLVCLEVFYIRVLLYMKRMKERVDWIGFAFSLTDSNINRYFLLHEGSMMWFTKVLVNHESFESKLKPEISTFD